MTDNDKLNKLIDLVDPLIEQGLINFTFGKLEGTDFLIVEDHDEIALVTGLLNGFDGLMNHFGGWNGETLEDQKNKLIAEKLNTDPEQYGTLSRLDKEIKAIDSVIAYNKHLEDNNIDNPIALDDIIEYGFSDEFVKCSSCYDEIVRTSPNSYSWVAPLYVDSEAVCSTCIKNGYFDEYVLENYKNERKSIPDDFDLDSLGLVKINRESFENGFYGGQRDEPQPIIDSLNDHNIDVWFKVYPCQFMLSFDVYVLEKDLEKAIEVLSETNTKAKIDPAVVLQQKLKSARIG